MHSKHPPYYQTCFEFFETFEAAWLRDNRMSPADFWERMWPSYETVLRSNRPIAAKLEELYDVTLLLETLSISQKALNDKKAREECLMSFNKNRAILPDTLFKRDIDGAEPHLKEFYQLFQGAQTISFFKPLLAPMYDAGVPLSWETSERLIEIIREPGNKVAILGWDKLVDFLWQLRGVIYGLQQVASQRIESRLPPNPSDN